MQISLNTHRELYHDCAAALAENRAVADAKPVSARGLFSAVRQPREHSIANVVFLGTDDGAHQTRFSTFAAGHQSSIRFTRCPAPR